MKDRGHPAPLTQPSLRWRLLRHIGMMLSGLILLSIAAVWGINGLHQDFGGALEGNRQLRTVYEIGVPIAAARTALSESPADRAKAASSLRQALTKLQAADEQNHSLVNDLAPRLAGAIDQVAAVSAPANMLDPLLSHLAELSSEIRQRIVATQHAADQRRTVTLAAVLATCCGVIVVGALGALFRYRAVMRPLKVLSDGTRRVAAGDFAHRLPIAGDREFAAVAHDFNRMAEELVGFRDQMEEKVAVKSRQLLRSERLASIGLLAAGVAHEINNPLSIITGYGERALRSIPQSDNDPVSTAAHRAISVMCEEAFRCKGITDRLLALARPGSDVAGAVSLRTVVEDVVGCLSGLPDYTNRRITVQSHTTDDLTVFGNDGPMRQVVLNLLLNALTATDSTGGSIQIDLRTVAGGLVELSIADDGRGMSADTLEKVFEPFFSMQRGEKPGTGLGLSITHAIVVDHGGSIHAHSDGPGMGSRFIVRLPASQKGVDIVQA